MKIIAYIWQLTLTFKRYCKKGIKNIKWDSIFGDEISVVIGYEQTSPVTETATGRHAVPSRGSNIHLFYTFWQKHAAGSYKKYRYPRFLFLQSCNYVIIGVLKQCLLSAIASLACFVSLLFSLSRRFTMDHWVKHTDFGHLIWMEYLNTKN